MTAIQLHSPAGVLLGLHDAPTGPVPERGPRGAVVCHPHPLHGGTMDNKVAHSLAKALAAGGLHVVRFNFRGTAGSEGRYDGGRGEQQDVAVALDEAERLSGGPLLVAGFSFGSFVGLSRALHDARVVARLAVAPPVNHYDYAAIAASPVSLAVIYALADELVPAAEVERWLSSCACPPRVIPVPGAGHLFHGKLSVIRQATAGLAASLRQGAPPPGNASGRPA